MISCWYAHAGSMVSAPLDAAPDGAKLLWIDLLHPDDAERRQLEGWLNYTLPNAEEIAEIELSSRLYHDGERLVMTMPVIANADSEAPEMGPLCLIISADLLVSLHYNEPRSLAQFHQKLANWQEPATPASLAIGLLDSVADRAADIMEILAPRIEKISRQIFTPTATRQRKMAQGIGMRDVLNQLGHSGDVITRLRESLTGLQRLCSFFAASSIIHLEQHERQRLHGVALDVQALLQHADFMTQRVTFLLDASIGVVQIEQNNIVRIFSVAAVAFLPPTLVGTIYGMNFHYMPELHWVFGYPFALLLMLLSAVLPLWFFKRKGWL